MWRVWFMQPLPKVRILDTPGSADTRSIQQDGLHKWSIATQIKEHIDSITAVLVLANARVTVGTDYALSTLSAMFPKSLSPRVSFMFTNVLSPLHWNFSLETLPPELRGAPQFLLNNPITLQRKYLKLKDDPNMKKRRADLRNDVKAGEQNALQMLVELFDWLDSLEPQDTTEIVTGSQKREVMSTRLAPVAINSAVSCSPGTRFYFFSFSLLSLRYIRRIWEAAKTMLEPGLSAILIDW